MLEVIACGLLLEYLLLVVTLKFFGRNAKITLIKMLLLITIKTSYLLYLSLFFPQNYSLDLDRFLLLLIDSISIEHNSVTSSEPFICCNADAISE